MARGNGIRVFRQFALLVLLLAIAGGSYLTRTRTTSWQETLWVAIYPIAADDSETTADYIRNLDSSSFVEIEKFMSRESNRFGIELERPVRIDLGTPVTSMPPAPPESGNPLSIGWWSLRLRWWANDATARQTGATPDIRLFLVYHDPVAETSVPHSLGLQKGLLGVVHLFASRKQSGSNHVIATHELLHTLGATDKYEPGTNLPAYPDGYAEPRKSPRYPQQNAEIMGGRIPLSKYEALTPQSLKNTLVGPATAAEIGWASTGA